MEPVITLSLACAIYVVPALIALSRHHHQRWAIVILNLLVGWSGLGWIAALVWACTMVIAPAAPPPDWRWRLPRPDPTPGRRLYRGL